MKITLTKNELLYIDDSCTLLVENDAYFEGNVIPLRGVEMSAKMPIPGDLMVKIGSKVLEILTEDTPETSVDVTFDELILLRELANSQVKFGTEFIGLSLKKKIYDALLSSINQDTADDLIENLKFLRGQS